LIEAGDDGVSSAAELGQHRVHLVARACERGHSGQLEGGRRGVQETRVDQQPVGVRKLGSSCKSQGPGA
jgi:hypothetical protein